MPFSINTNATARVAERSVERSQADLATTVQRLAGGLRVNGARDDAAGLAVADRLDARVRGIGAAQRNLNDGVSLAQVAEDALGAIAGNLQRVRELAVQAANGANSAPDRAALQREVAQLLAEIDRVATQTTYNGSSLLDGSFAVKTFQVGADLGQRITMPTIQDVHTSTLGTWAGFQYEQLNLAYPVSTPGELVFVAGGKTVDFGIVQPDTRNVLAAFNSGQVQGLSASINPTLYAAGISAAHATTSGSATFTVNGVAIRVGGIAGGAALAANRAAAVSAINAQSAATGVSALDTGSGVSLSAGDGRSIQVDYAAGTFAGSTQADFGLADGPWANQPVAATIGLRYVAPAGVSGFVGFYHDPYWYSGGWVASQGTPIAQIDVSTAAGASAALDSIDIALGTVDASRAALGAVQNRFTAAAQNLDASGENLAASRSRIVDADFATETANLARSTMLHQASTAMLAQANQLPQQLIGLLL
ncbi:flagellin [Piscinibacter koreensis]|uniref:Flagellin n=1 Tax=Piscinibacter koreensis TaxID=2742824 RepID=A0A7Y6NNG6_9BURK|nr:flagellin [Schlegelella koreensis]NUZ06448.1 flagellin [Schlegelella koreensis]